jgi:hypothetical protein
MAPTEADIAREDVSALHEQIQSLEQRIAELEGQLALAQKDETTWSAAVPVVVDLDIQRLSGAEDGDRDGVIDTLVVYLTPKDARGRFTQMVGEVAATVVAVEAGEEAQTLATLRLSPAEVQDAYRSSFMGTHYVMRIPFNAPSELAETHVHVEFLDGLQADAVKAERRLALRAP